MGFSKWYIIIKYIYEHYNNVDCGEHLVVHWLIDLYQDHESILYDG